jgi:hypothetical protein
VTWLELLDERGEVIGRRPADALPCTVGSEPVNALVSRASGVEGRHAEVSLSEGGAILVRDLGTAAGLRLEADGARLDSAELVPGLELFIGGARLRLAAERPSAVVPAGHAAPVAALVAWSDRPAVKIAAPLVLLVAGALMGWILSADEDPLTAGLAVGAAVLVAEAMWAGGWALVNRIRYGRARFGQHFAVGVLGSAVALVLGEAAGWVEFLKPGGALAALASFASITLIWLVALRLHLRVMVPEGTLRARRLTAVFAVLLGGCFAWAPHLADKDFDAQAEYAVELKPISPGLVPALTPQSYAADLRQLERELLADRDTLVERSP